MSSPVRPPAKRVTDRGGIAVALVACSLASCLATLDAPIYWTPDASHTPLDAQQGVDASRDDAADHAPESDHVFDGSTDTAPLDAMPSDAPPPDSLPIDVPSADHVSFDARPIDGGSVDATFVEVGLEVFALDAIATLDVTVDALGEVSTGTDARLDAPTDVACSPACGTGSACCGGACVNVSTSETNCGGCGIGCPGGQVCQSGTCAACPLSLGICISGGNRCCLLGLCLGLCP